MMVKGLTVDLSNAFLATIS